jgi:carbon starvation protein
MAILFAATTMDTGVRLLRFVVQEAGEVAKVKISNGVGTLVVLVTGMGLTFSQGADGAGGLRIWPLFGTSNQLLASLTLSIVVVMLIRKRRNPAPALVPLAFVFVMSFWAALAQLGDLYDARDWLLLAIDVVIIVAALWVALEAVVAMRRASQEPPEAPDADVTEKAGTRA